VIITVTPNRERGSRRTVNVISAVHGDATNLAAHVLVEETDGTRPA